MCGFEKGRIRHRSPDEVREPICQFVGGELKDSVGTSLQTWIGFEAANKIRLEQKVSD